MMTQIKNQFRTAKYAPNQLQMHLEPETMLLVM